MRTIWDFCHWQLLKSSRTSEWLFYMIKTCQYYELHACANLECKNGILTTQISLEKTKMCHALYQMSCVVLIAGHNLKTLPQSTKLQFHSNMYFQLEMKEKKILFLLCSWFVVSMLATSSDSAFAILHKVGAHLPHMAAWGLDVLWQLLLWNSNHFSL